MPLAAGTSLGPHEITSLLGAQGILEGAACGFAGAVLVLLPGIVTHPTQAPPYLLAYGGLAAVVGLAVGVVLWIGASLTLRLYARCRRSAQWKRPDTDLVPG